MGKVEQRVRKANESVKELDLSFFRVSFCRVGKCTLFLTHMVSEFSTLSDIDNNSQRVKKIGNIN